MPTPFNRTNLLKLKPTCGVYAIVGPSARRYIGKALNIRRRLLHHLGLLTKKQHCNPHLSSSWLKNGPDTFSFEVLLVCWPGALDRMEVDLIDHYRENGTIYNHMVPENHLSGPLRHSPESRAKMRASATGRTASHEARAGMRAAQRDRPEYSPEHRAKLRQAALKQHAENPPFIGSEAGAKIRAKLLGIKRSEETRARMRGAQRARRVSEEMLKLRVGEG